MKRCRTWATLAALWLAGLVSGLAPAQGQVAPPAAASPRGAPSRQQALAAIEAPEPALRLAGVARLGEVGRMADAERLVARLRDADAEVRDAAQAALWQVWSRSGDAAVDALLARGTAQMQRGELDAALASFDAVVRRRPGFAEGWNKRATVHYLRGDNALSLADCDQVLRRNRHHFGALSGAGQIHLRLGQVEQALAFFERAVAVNPNLIGPQQTIPMLEQQLRELGRTRI